MFVYISTVIIDLLQLAYMMLCIKKKKDLLFVWARLGQFSALIVKNEDRKFTHIITIRLFYHLNRRLAYT